MDNEYLFEWINIAGEDFNAAQILNEAVRKPYEIICYHCAQAAEKYLKGYLVSKGIEPKKTHDLRLLFDYCVELDANYNVIIAECAFLNNFASDIRYPRRYEVTGSDVNSAIAAVEKIRHFQPILELRNLAEGADNS